MVAEKVELMAERMVEKKVVLMEISRVRSSVD